MSTKNYLLSYIYGFVLSLALTLGAYFVATHHVLWGTEAMAALLGFALVQFVVQIIFFLHLSLHKVDGGDAAREKLIVLGFAVVVVLILTGGSLWIMTTLNGRMMPSEAQMSQYMDDQQGI